MAFFLFLSLICLPCLSTDVIIASLDAHQDSPGNDNGGITDHVTFVAGMVHLKVIIQKPQDLERITFDWQFGDHSQLFNSTLQNVTHNFTAVKSCTVNVSTHGWSQHRYYFGTTSKALKFKGMICLI